MIQLQYTMYHKLLRVMGLTLALLLVFDSGLATPVTTQLSSSVQIYTANVIGAGSPVGSLEYSGLLSTEQTFDVFDYSSYLLSTILFIILVLLVLNYALDFARDRRLRITLKDSIDQ